MRTSTLFLCESLALQRNPEKRTSRNLLFIKKLWQRHAIFGSGSPKLPLRRKPLLANMLRLA